MKKLILPAIVLFCLTLNFQPLTAQIQLGAELGLNGHLQGHGGETIFPVAQQAAVEDDDFQAQLAPGGHLGVNVALPVGCGISLKTGLQHAIRRHHWKVDQTTGMPGVNKIPTDVTAAHRVRYSFSMARFLLHFGSAYKLRHPWFEFGWNIGVAHRRTEDFRFAASMNGAKRNYSTSQQDNLAAVVSGMHMGFGYAYRFGKQAVHLGVAYDSDGYSHYAQSGIPTGHRFSLTSAFYIHANQRTRM